MSDFRTEFINFPTEVIDFVLRCLLQHVRLSTSDGFLEVSCFMFHVDDLRSTYWQIIFVYIGNGVGDFIIVRLIIIYLFIFRKQNGKKTLLLVTRGCKPVTCFDFMIQLKSSMPNSM